MSFPIYGMKSDAFKTDPAPSSTPSASFPNVSVPNQSSPNMTPVDWSKQEGVSAPDAGMTPEMKKILDRARPLNLPDTPIQSSSAFESIGNVLFGGDVMGPQRQANFGHKARLISARNFPSEYVVFEVTPEIRESRGVDYESVAPVHLPGSIQIYKRTASRVFDLTVKFVSRSTSQATQNIEYLQLLRGWTMPYFGIRSEYDSSASLFGGGQSVPMPSVMGGGGSMLGAPPDVLYFYAHSSGANDGGDRSGTAGRINLKKIPVVITNLDISYPTDVDYIYVEGTNEPFPIVMEVSITLKETHSPNAYEDFSLSMFKKGHLVQF